MKPDPSDDPRQRPVDEADETAWLAEHLESLPPIKPRPEWLAESKRRMLQRFDAREGRQPDQTEGAD